MRAEHGQSDSAQWLLKIGNGNVVCTGEGIPPNSMVMHPQCNITDDIVSDVFPDVSNLRDLVQTIILTPMNDNALSMNDSVLKILPGKSVSCLSIDKPVCDTEEEADNYPVEFLNSLTASGMPPHNLILKEGAIVMLLRNLDIKKGLCNGTCVLVVHLHTHDRCWNSYW